PIETPSHLATQLYYNYPDIYSSSLPTSIAADYPLLSKVIAGEYKKGEPYSNTVTLNTKGGTSFLSFAKTNEFNKDLYDGVVAPTLKADLIAETWRRGSEVPLECSLTYHTNDALEIQVGATSEFKYTKDHSKLARSTDSTKPWVCIGDINRMTSQYVRGGGTTCLSSTFVWQAFNVIKDENRC
ncbi:deoxyribonuclease-2 domain protein, partial [Cooperia oncophora]